MRRFVNISRQFDRMLCTACCNRLSSPYVRLPHNIHFFYLPFLIMPSFHTYSCMLHSYGALLVSQGRVIIISWAIDDTMPSTLARYAHTCIGHEHISPARNPYWSGFSSSHRDRWISCSTSSKIPFSHFCIIARARCG